MRKIFPASELARDERFMQVNAMDRMNDPRAPRTSQAEKSEKGKKRRGTGVDVSPENPSGPDAARSLMHGIFMGEIQALEGLAIDVFHTMRELGKTVGDPLLEFCEDWMLADEVTHVKMGSDWLRKITAEDPDRQKRALEFQRVVDKIFSLGGTRGDEDDSPIKLARRFRELAGFADDEIDETSPLGRSKLRSLDPVSIWAESGAFEDPKRPRQLSDAATADVIGRLLLKLRDRQDADFGAPDTDDDVDIAYRTAWDIYAMGRLNRLGYRGQRQRRLYHWRNRCGFTDVADEAFEEIWTGDGLTYADLVERVDRSKAVRPEPAAT